MRAQFFFFIALASLSLSVIEITESKAQSIQELAERGKAIRFIATCGGDKKIEKGPSSAKDLDQVELGAKSGSAVCQLLLGRWLEDGNGVEIDFDRAKRMYEAATVTNPLGYIGLGRMIELGKGQTSSAELAVSMYQKASEAGTAEGHIELGRMYEYGIGLKKDLPKAANLYRLAARRWYDTAWERLDYLQSNFNLFTSDQVNADQLLWKGLLFSRFQHLIEVSPEVRQFKEALKAKIRFEFIKGKSRHHFRLSSLLKTHHLIKYYCPSTLDSRCHLHHSIVPA